MRSIKKRGISPVISTVLLIMVVIILAAIIILWAQGFIKEKVLKFDKPIENVCSEVSIKTFINNDEPQTFGFTNIGNVPIHAIDLKINRGWDSEIQKIEERVDAGFSMMIEGHFYNPDEEVTIIPILLGKTKDGGVKEYSCPDSAGFVV